MFNVKFKKNENIDYEWNVSIDGSDFFFFKVEKNQIDRLRDNFNFSKNKIKILISIKVKKKYIYIKYYFLIRLEVKKKILI